MAKMVTASTVAWALRLSCFTVLWPSKPLETTRRTRRPGSWASCFMTTTMEFQRRMELPQVPCFLLPRVMGEVMAASRPRCRTEGLGGSLLVVLMRSQSMA